MRVNAISALALASVVAAQTSSKCDPTKQKGCPADTAFGKNKVDCDFTQGKCDAIKEFDGTSLKYGDKGAVFSIATDGNAPTTETNKYIFFGRVDVTLQIAPGAGVITSVVLESDDLEEIDWEWLGGKDNEVQTNYFPKGGDNGVYNRGGTSSVSSASSTFHTYTVDWTPDAVNWMIDGKSVRILKASDAGDQFPQTPMRVKLGTWAPTAKGGSAPGSIEWAGGPPDFSKGPFNAYYKTLKITDYAGGNSATSKDVKEYVYGDDTGSMSSIQVKMSDGSSGSGSDSSSSAAASSKAQSKTSSAADSSSTKAAASSTEAKTTMAVTTSSGASESTDTTQTTSSSADSQTSSAAGTTSSSPSPTSGAPQKAVAFGSALVGAVAAAVFLF